MQEETRNLPVRKTRCGEIPSCFVRCIASVPVDSVDRALRELAGVGACQVRLDEGLAVVEGKNVDEAAVVAAVEGGSPL